MLNQKRSTRKRRILFELLRKIVEKLEMKIMFDSIFNGFLESDFQKVWRKE